MNEIAFKLSMSSQIAKSSHHGVNCSQSDVRLSDIQNPSQMTQYEELLGRNTTSSF